MRSPAEVVSAASRGRIADERSSDNLMRVMYEVRMEIPVA
jgi:hypothetical protein